jgi:hypothetical protein
VSPLQYKFLRYYAEAQEWTVLQNYSTSNVVTWTATAPGTYWLQVWVRSAGSTAAYEDWQSTNTFIVTNSLSVRSVTANLPSPVATGTPVWWIADAGGAASLQYKFLLLSLQTNTWTVLQDYSTTAIARWIPSAPGTYLMQVWVRKAGSTAAFEAWRNSSTFSVVVSATPVVYSVGPSVSAPAVGANVVWNVAAGGGGTAPLQYKFWLYHLESATWTLLRDYSPTAAANWTPNRAGAFLVQVWVRSTGSQAAYENWRNSYSVSVSP